MSGENIGGFQITKFPKARIPTLDFLAMGDRHHYVKSLIEVDVTEARRVLRDHKARTGVSFSFTAWLLKCIGTAAQQHKAVHSMMKGKRKIVTFDDVDISITVEKTIRGKRAPMPLVIRRANEKTVLEIHEEIRAAQKEKPEGATVLGQNSLGNKMKIYTALPGVLRILMVKQLLKDPFRVKKMMGTILVTSVGMFGKVSGWAIPTTAHPLAFAIGGISKKAGVIEDKIEIREFLTITALFNHDVVDGAPAARFVFLLVKLLENAYGLKKGMDKDFHAETG